MLKSIAQTNRGPLLLLGLSHQNLAKLVAGDPISVEVGPMIETLGAQAVAGAQLSSAHIVLFAGESEESMAKDLERHGLAPLGSARSARDVAQDREGRTMRTVWRGPTGP